MISFPIRTKWQNCRGYVPRYERTPKNGGIVIHSVFAIHTEVATYLEKKKKTVNYREEEIPECGCIYG